MAAFGGLAGVALALTACAGSSSSTASVAPVTAPSAPSAPVVATSAVLTTASSRVGTILVDSKGDAVYMFTADTHGTSACTGTCLKYWPIVPAPAMLPSPMGSVSAKLGVLVRPDGSKQLTVDGRPVYTYAGDTSPGMVNGQGADLSGGVWWVLAPDGTLDKTSAMAPSSAPSPAMAPSSAPSPAATPSKSTSTGGGGWA
jgi:predicted lipoprotein with Yx(FWY)xxD motif